MNESANASRLWDVLLNRIGDASNVNKGNC